MKHVTFACKPLLVGDEVTDELLRYAALLGKVGSADCLRVRCIDAKGEEVEASLLLNPGTVMMAESTTSELPEPDNTVALAYLHERLGLFEVYSVPDHATDQNG
ncbi:MAG TPA: hypothetical protein VIG28_05160 [Leifsonia sp.]